MEPIRKYIKGEHLDDKKNAGRQTERGELLKYFLERINPGRVKDGLPPMTMGRMGRVVVAVPTRDLYYLKSVCDDAAARGGSSAFSKKFWWEVNPKKHQDKK